MLEWRVNEMTALIYTLILLGPKATPNGVEFSIYAPYAESVFVAGDFNNWNTSQLPLKKDQLGVWKRVIYLPPGRYEYKFIVDGEYVADPMNPTTAGPYGNSVLWVKEDGSISLTPPPGGNLPANPNVFVHGDLRGFLNFDKGIDSSKAYSLKNTFYDAKMDIGGVVGGSRLWTRFRYNTESGQLGDIPVSLERLEVNLSRGVTSLKGFYNRFVLQFDDPFVMVGYVNQLGDPYGRGEEGVLVSTSFFLKDNLQVLYGRKPHGERDLLAARYRIFPGHMKLGVTLRKGDRHEGNFDEIYAMDGAFKLWRFGLKAEIAHGNTFCDSAFSYSTNMAYLGIGWKSVEAFLSNQTNRYADGNSVSFRDMGLNYTASKLPIGSLKLIFASTRVSVFEGDAQMPDSVLWMRLFDYYRVHRWQIAEYPLAGYASRVRRGIEYSIDGHFFADWNIDIRYNGYSSNLLARNIADETIFRLQARKGRVEFATDIRNVNYRFKGFGSGDTVQTYSFSDRYFELGYAFNAFVALKISWGFNPITLDDEYGARDDFLMEQGLTPSAAQNAYLRMPMVIRDAESALEATNSRFSIWTVIKF